MKINYIPLLFIVLLAACAPKTDKKAELEQLKVQRDQLNTQIAQLEAIVNPSENDKVKAVAVKIDTISNSVFSHFIEVQGIVDADQNVSVSPQSPGIVTAVYAKEGMAVKRGQLLAALDDMVLKESKNEIQTQLDLATTIFNKQKALWEKNIGSEVQFLQAKANKESLERRIKTIDEQIALMRVTSPINGTVEDVPLKVGQLASPGAPNSVIRIINMSTAKVEAEVSETFATRIKNGNQVIVSFPDLGKEIATTLHFTSRFIDPSNRTFKVECKLQSGEVELRANMIAYVKINDYTNEKALCLPVNNVQSNQSGKFVYVARQEGAQWIAARQPVKTGVDYNGVVEILEGLSEGDIIVSSGFQNLKEGEAIIF